MLSNDKIKINLPDRNFKYEFTHQSIHMGEAKPMASKDVAFGIAFIAQHLCHHVRLDPYPIGYNAT
jgi:hypothetical protein